MKAVAVLMNTGCGHVAKIADTIDELHELATTLEAADPRWTTSTLDVDDALDRVVDGPCNTCRAPS